MLPMDEETRQRVHPGACIQRSLIIRIDMYGSLFASLLRQQCNDPGPRVTVAALWERNRETIRVDSSLAVLGSCPVSASTAAWTTSFAALVAGRIGHGNTDAYSTAGILAIFGGSCPKRVPLLAQDTADANRPPSAHASQEAFLRDDCFSPCHGATWVARHQLGQYEEKWSYCHDGPLALGRPLARGLETLAASERVDDASRSSPFFCPLPRPCRACLGPRSTSVNVMCTIS
jgi:hypothetical protein